MPRSRKIITGYGGLGGNLVQGGNRWFGERHVISKTGAAGFSNNSLERSAKGLF